MGAPAVEVKGLVLPQHGHWGWGVRGAVLRVSACHLFGRSLWNRFLPLLGYFPQSKENLLCIFSVTFSL